MKIIIANSKHWFRLDEDLKSKHDVLFINCPELLNVDEIEAFNPSFIFFPHWSWAVPTEIHSRYNCVAFHTAPLPYGRGGSPIQNLIMRGFDASPVCAIKMNEQLDSGPIYLKETLNLVGTLREIFVRLSVLVNRMIDEITANMPCPKEQSGDVLVFKRLNRVDNCLPKDISIDELYNRIRMVDDVSYPNAFLEYGQFTVEFLNVSLSEGIISCEAKISTKLCK